MKLLVIPTTDWTGHPVPNRLNFVFDRLAIRHDVDVCHFKLFSKAVRETKCNLVDMDDEWTPGVRSYYLKRFFQHSSRISKISNEYDAIISSNILPGFISGLQNCPMIVDYMDLYPESAASYFSPPMDRLVHGTVSFISEINMETASGIITPTDRFKKYLNSRISTSVEVIPNGVDTKLMHPVDSGDVIERYDLGSPVLGYAGSLESWIALDDVFEMFSAIQKRYPRASILIVGGALHTDYEEYLKKEARKRKIPVTFTGNIPYNELAPYISAMDIGLNPRKPKDMNRLTMGSKVLTYLACGVPVLSSNMPAAEEKFDRGKGVYRYGNKEEFMRKLDLALSSKVDPAVIKKYDWDIIAKKYEMTIRKFL